MTDNTQSEALRLADEVDEVARTYPDMAEVSAELRRQHARIVELEAQLEAIGAGGVTGPLIGQPQAMPDLSALTERGAKAWAGVDAQGLREGRWYMVTHDGVATLCEDRRDAEKEAKDADMAWPHSGPHRAVQLVEASTAGFTAADMATASAQGFRDGVASISANAGEPTCDMRTVVAVAVTMLYDTHPEDVCRVFDRNDLETIVSITEPLGHGRVEDIYRDAWDHVAAPPTAQAEGWMPIKTAPQDGRTLLLGYFNSAGKWRTTRGEWMSQDYIDEYAEDPDCMSPGWYETTVEGDDGKCWPIDPTHWMPLPPPPTTSAGSGKGE